MQYRSWLAFPIRWAALTATAALMSLAGAALAQQADTTVQSAPGAMLVKPVYRPFKAYPHIQVTPRPEEDEEPWHIERTNMPNDKSARGISDPSATGVADLTGLLAGSTTAQPREGELAPTRPKIPYTPAKFFNPGGAALGINPLFAPPPPGSITHNNFQGIGYTGWIPPDTNGAIGPYNYVETTNSEFSIYDLHGNLEYSIDYNSYFGNSDFYFDPHVIYDPWGKHFIFVVDHRQDSTHGAWYNVIVTSNADAMSGSWYYQFNMRLDGSSDTDHWPDFPLVGYDNQALYMEGTMFQFGGGSQYPKMRILDMAQIESASSAGWWDFWSFSTNGNLDWFTCPAEMNTYPGQAFWVTTPFYGTNYVSLRRITNPVAWASGGGGPSVSLETISTQSYAPPPAVVQPNGVHTLEGSDCRTLNAMYENGNLDIAHGMAHDWGDGLGSRSAIHWLRLDIYNTPATSLRDFFWGAAGLDYFYPSVAVNFSGDTTETFARSGQSEYAGFRETSWRSSESGPEGSTQVKGGEGTYVRLDNSSRNRWGDYSKASLDPFDGQTVWVTGEWATSSNTWSTWIAETNFKPFTSVSVYGSTGTIGQSVQLAANLTRTDTGANLSGQNIDFYVDGGYVGTTSTDSSGNAYLNWTIPNGSATGDHSVEAIYQRTTSYNDSFGYGTLDEQEATTTSSPNVSGAIGQKVTLKATLTRNDTHAAIANEPIYFYIDGNYVGTDNTSSAGLAQMTYQIPESLGVGSHTIWAYFFGDVNFAVSVGTPTLTVTKANTKFVVTSFTEPIGKIVNLSATLKTTSNTVVAGRTVNFLIDGASVGSATTTSTGKASLSYHITTLALGSHTITAKFAGDSDYNASTGSGTLTVTQAVTKITVTTVSGARGTTVTLKATIKRTSDNTGVSGLTLAFKVNTASAGSATTNASGVATRSYTIPASMTVGAHTITVTFAGTTLYQSSSGTGTLNVK